MCSKKLLKTFEPLMSLPRKEVERRKMCKRLLINVTCLLICNTLLVSSVLAMDEAEAWLEFKEKYQKSYSHNEEHHRMQVFLDNLRHIQNHNTKLSPDSPLTFVQGINSLSDLTQEEIVKTRCGFRAPSSSYLSEFSDNVDNFLDTLLAALNRTTETTSYRAWYDSLTNSTDLDYRRRGLVSRVKDQGSCGSCWSFATTGALESILASRGKGTLLSEQNLVDCSSRYGNYGCSGGLMDAALRYVRDHGIMASKDYPYSAANGNCKFDPSKSVMTVRGSSTLPSGNEALLRIALAISGPIPVAIDAGGRSFHNYKSGVYNDNTCRNSNSALNHAVLLVGYGTDRVGGDYWIVKNSWGNKWGNHGYIKMARNKRNLCGIASFAVVPLASR